MMKRVILTALLTLAMVGSGVADEALCGRVVEVVKGNGTYLVEFPRNVKPELRDVFVVTHVGKPAGEVMVLSAGKRAGTFVVAPMASLRGVLDVGDGCEFVRHAKVPTASGPRTSSTNTSGQTVEQMNRRGAQVQAEAAREYLAEYAVYEPAARQALAALEDVTSSSVDLAGFVAKVRVAADALEIAHGRITQHFMDMYKLHRNDSGLPASYVNMSRALGQYVQAARQWQRWINDPSASPGSDKGISGYLGTAASLVDAARFAISQKQ